MSFSDMMSSGRGPGVIGLVMALVVMIGFGVLFVFAFDEGMQGGERTIESFIAQQRREINTQKVMLEHGTVQLDAASGRDAAAAGLRRTKGEIESLEMRLSDLVRVIEEAETGLEVELEEFARYQDQYRSHVRNLAKGREMDELKTSDGTIYHEVVIRDVTAIGVQIRHRDGQKRIPFEELPEDMIDHFQFNDELKAIAIRNEREMHRRHEEAVAAAAAMDGAERDDQENQEALAGRERILLEIATRERQLTALRREIGQLEGEVHGARANASSARAAGRMHVDQEKPLQGKLDAKRRQMAELRQVLLRLKANP